MVGATCQVMMAEGGEKSDENIVDENLVMKRNYTSAIWIYVGFRRDDVLQTQVLCVKHAEQLLQLLEETQPTSITTCSTTIKTYTNNSKLTPSLTVQLMICKLQYLFIYCKLYHHRNTEQCYRTSQIFLISCMSGLDL